MNLKTVVRISIVSFSILVACLIGCDQFGELITPDTDTGAALKIGLIQPRDHFASFADGAKVALSQVNASGGLLGMQVEFIERDNQPAGMRVFPDAQTTIDIARELIEQENVVALLGPIYSSITVQVGPVVQELGLPMIPAAAAARANKAGNFIFLAVAPNTYQGEVMARFVDERLNKTTAATIHLDGDTFSVGHVEGFKAAFQSLGGEIVAEEVYQAGDTTFDMQLSRIQAAAPEIIFLSSFIPEVPLVIAAARNMGIDVPFIGGDSWDEPGLLTTLADNTPLNNVYFCVHFSADTPADALHVTPEVLMPARQFTQAYTVMFGRPPDGIAGSGYDAMKLLAEAIRRAQSTDPDAIRTALAETQNFAGAAFISYYDENRHPVKTMTIQEIRDGQIHFLDIYPRFDYGEF